MMNSIVLVINVATKSIEETAAIIINTLQLDSKKRTFLN